MARGEGCTRARTVSVWGQRRNYKNLLCPESFSEFLTASQFLLSKKTWRLYYRKKRSFGSNWTYSPSKTFMSVTLICLLSSFPIIFISCKAERLSLPLFRFRTLQQFKKKKKKRRFTSIRFSQLQKNSALRANGRGVENTSTSAARYQPQD